MRRGVTEERTRQRKHERTTEEAHVEIDRKKIEDK